LISRITENLGSIFWSLLSSDFIRYYFVRIRYQILKRNLRVLESFKDTANILYNMDFNRASFGCGGRMALLLFPLRALLFPLEKKAKVLIIGPRTEDDIFWARAIGLRSARGFDLFSYSPFIDVGDANNMPEIDGAYDAVLLGWVTPYTPTPERLISEVERVVKPGGYVGVAWHWVADKKYLETDTIRDNKLNEPDDFLCLFKSKEIVYKYSIDSELGGEDGNKAFIIKV